MDKQQLLKKLNLSSFALQGREAIDLLESIKSYRVLKSKSELLNSGIDGLDVNSISEETRQEIISLSLAIEAADKELKQLKASEPSNPKISELEIKLEELKVKAGQSVLNENTDFVSKIVAYNAETEDSKKRLKLDLKAVRSEIFDYIVKVFKLDISTFESLSVQELSSIVEFIEAENNISETNFF